MAYVLAPNWPSVNFNGSSLSVVNSSTQVLSYILYIMKKREIFCLLFYVNRGYHNDRTQVIFYEQKHSFLLVPHPPSDDAIFGRNVHFLNISPKKIIIQDAYCSIQITFSNNAKNESNSEGESKRLKAKVPQSAA